jgi:hypothetical protein
VADHPSCPRCRRGNKAATAWRGPAERGPSSYPTRELSSEVILMHVQLEELASTSNCHATIADDDHACMRCESLFTLGVTLLRKI